LTQIDAVLEDALACILDLGSNIASRPFAKRASSSSASTSWSDGTTPSKVRSWKNESTTCSASALEGASRGELAVEAVVHQEEVGWSAAGERGREPCQEILTSLASISWTSICGSARSNDWISVCLDLGRIAEDEEAERAGGLTRRAAGAARDQNGDAEGESASRFITLPPVQRLGCKKETSGPVQPRRERLCWPKD